MASSITLRNTINWAQPFLKNQPLNVANMEPALTTANIVLGVMLGPPMVWRFNRNNIQIQVNGTNTDFLATVTDFGFMETLWLEDGTSKMTSLEGATSLPRDSTLGRPKQVAPQYDDNGGTITFRVKPTPDATYIVYIDYQKKMVPLASFGSSWAPVPDEFAFIFNWGFLAIIGMLTNDARFPIWEKFFIARLLSTQDGLDDQAKAIFLGQWEALTKTLTRSSQSAGAAGNARGSQ